MNACKPFIAIILVSRQKLILQDSLSVCVCLCEPRLSHHGTSSLIPLHNGDVLVILFISRRGNEIICNYVPFTGGSKSKSNMGEYSSPYVLFALFVIFSYLINYNMRKAMYKYIQEDRRTGYV